MSGSWWQQPGESFGEYVARLARMQSARGNSKPAAPLDGNSDPLAVNARPSENRELHADDKAILIAVGGSAFCAGLFGFYEAHPVLGSIFTLGGLVTMAPVSPFVRTHIHWIFGRPALWALAMATCLLLVADVGLKVWSPSEGAAQIATLKSHLDATAKERDEAKRQVERLRQQLLAASPAPSSNPLRHEDAKWTLVQNLAKSPFRNDCYLIVERYQTDYAEHLAKDFGDVLNAVGWIHHELLAATPLPPAFSVRSEETGPSRECANSLLSILNNSGLQWSTPRGAGNLAARLDFFPKEQKFNECSGSTGPCVVIGIGNEPEP